MNQNKQKCSQCQTMLDLTKVKYWNDDSGVHVFCDAYCSHDWHMERDRKKRKERKVK